MSWMYYDISSKLPSDTTEKQTLLTKVIDTMRATGKVYKERDFRDPIASWIPAIDRKVGEGYMRLCCHYAGTPGDHNSINVVIMFHYMKQYNLWVFALGFDQNDSSPGPLPKATKPSSNASNDKIYMEFVGTDGVDGMLDEAFRSHWQYIHSPVKILHTVANQNIVQTAGWKKIRKVEWALDQSTNWQRSDTLEIDSYGGDSVADKSQWWGGAENIKIDIHSVTRNNN